MLRDLRIQRALLLQGPVGPFFRRFARELEDRGIEVTKVNFNAGDALFYRGKSVVPFRGRMEEWPQFFRALVIERGIEAVFAFHDGRAIHREAIAVARKLGIPVWVFEEGYIRPDFVTLERDGVNGNSRMPRDPEFYRREAAEVTPPPPPIPVGNPFYVHALWTALHAVAKTLLFWRYPHYVHHRNTNAFYQTFCWSRGVVRKLWYRLRERRVLDRLVREHSGGYFFMPLQVFCDSSLQHSDYACMEDFIDEVVAAFAHHAPADTLLVVKHHPHDRPYRDYTRYLRDLGRRLGVADRIVYVHDLHLPTLLDHARGTITMNSTVGVTSLYHRIPVKVTGRAVYDIPGLTFQGTLAEFFRDPGAIDVSLLQAYVRYLRTTNQINGSYYKRRAALGSRCGLDLRVFPPARADGEPAVDAAVGDSGVHATEPATSDPGAAA